MDAQRYTHTGMKGLDARASLTIDPILNRNRKWHACNRVAGDTYKALCGVNLLAVDPEESCWGARVEERGAHRITCKRCRNSLGTGHESTAETPARGLPPLAVTHHDHRGHEAP